MKKELVAKIIIANFIDKSEPGEGPRKTSYPVLEFKNGLIMVEGMHSPDYFFPDKDSIQGHGKDIYVDCTDTEEIVYYTKLELAQSWGHSEDLGVGLDYEDCMHKVKQLLKG